MNFHFASPTTLLLLLLAALPLLPARRPTLRFSHVALVRSAHRSWRLRLRPLLPWLRAAGLALLVLALARPQLSRTLAVAAEAETAVVFALDVSNSMMARDLQPDRLGAAKEMIAAAIDARPHDAFGLVLFAGRAIIQVPPTRDHAALHAALAQVGTARQMGIADGTALGLGIAAAAGLLADTPAPHRAVILLTDGVSTDEAISPETAAAAAAQLGIQVHTVAIGQSGLAPFPQSGPQGDYLVYWQSQLDETVLQTVAELTGATFSQSIDRRTLRQTTAVLTAPTAAPPLLQQVDELFAWLIGGGLALLLLDWTLRHTALRLLPEDAS